MERRIRKLSLAMVVILVMAVIVACSPAFAFKYLLVTNQNNTFVEKFNLDGTYAGRFGDIGVTGVTKGGFAIVQGGNGAVYVSNLNYNYTAKFNQDGSLVAAVWSTDAAGAMQLSWDYGRNLLVATGFYQYATGIDPNAGTITPPTNFGPWPGQYPTGISVGPDGKWYISQWIANDPGAADVLAWDPATDTTTTIIHDLMGNAAGTYWDGNDLYAADYSKGKVIKWNSVSGGSVFASGLTTFTPSVLVYGGKVYVPEQGANRVSIFNLDGSSAGSIIGNMLNSPAGIAVYDDGVIPEPSSFLAFLSGIGGLGGILWRRKRV